MDREEFQNRVIELTDRMYRISWSILRNNEDCRDAMQETALKAWKKRHSLREEGYFATWLTRILINECRNIQRRRRMIVSFSEICGSQSNSFDPIVSMALKALDEKLRLPLVMHAIEGMSYDEISKALRISKASVTGRIQRAREKLRKDLEA